MLNYLIKKYIQMKVMLKSFTVIFLILIISLSSCKLESKCWQQVEAPVYALEAPDSALIDSVVNIKVKYMLYNGCGKFSVFNYNTDSDTTFIHVIAVYDGCECPDTLTDSIAYFKFTGKAARDYVFVAYTYDNQVLSDTLTVYKQ